MAHRDGERKAGVRTGVDSTIFKARTAVGDGIVVYLRDSDQNVRIAALTNLLDGSKGHATILGGDSEYATKVTQIVSDMAKNDPIDYVRILAQKVQYVNVVKHLPTFEDTESTRYSAGYGDVRMLMEFVRKTPEDHSSD
jgi:hypothetical protein